MKNEDLFERAKAVIPGGVDSPVRAFRKVGGTPRFIVGASGPYLFDAEGKRYIDFVLSWGPMILGHGHPSVVEALKNQAETGTSYGAPTELEIMMAETICQAIPSIERVRFVNSGTEAVMSALRLARAFTGRDLIVKFEGCYHGHVDSLLVKAGSGALTFGIPDTAGVPSTIASMTVVLNYNDVNGFREFMAQHGQQIAAVIVEPIAGNMGVVLPKYDFLKSLRQETKQCGALLIFDEVITGFRFCFGSHPDFVGLRPDLTCLGKIIGGGMPVGAFGGRKDIMALLAPEGPVYQAGTLAGNPMAMRAGLATLEVLRTTNPYERLEETLGLFVQDMQAEASRRGIPLAVNHRGSMAGIFFQEGEVRTFADVMKSDTKLYAQFFHALLDRGVYLAPSPYETLFVSTAHGKDEMEKAIVAVREALAII